MLLRSAAVTLRMFWVPGVSVRKAIVLGASGRESGVPFASVRTTFAEHDPMSAELSSAAMIWSGSGLLLAVLAC
jgi:hypothetical protein